MTMEAQKFLDVSECEQFSEPDKCENDCKLKGEFCCILCRSIVDCNKCCDHATTGFFRRL